MISQMIMLSFQITLVFNSRNVNLFTFGGVVGLVICHCRTCVPKLFSQSSKNLGCIKDMRDWINSHWIWEFGADVSLDKLGREQLQELQVLLNEVYQNPNSYHEWKRIPNTLYGYSVKSCYIVFREMQNSHILNLRMKKAWNILWQTSSPSNVPVFGWRLLLQRLATWDELIKRGAVSGVYNRACVCFRNNKKIDSILNTNQEELAKHQRNKKIPLTEYIYFIWVKIMWFYNI